MLNIARIRNKSSSPKVFISDKKGMVSTPYSQYSLRHKPFNFTISQIFRQLLTTNNTTTDALPLLA